MAQEVLIPDQGEIGMRAAWPMLKKVLIANRGEIAMRVARGCRELGIRSVAVFSDPDAGAPHVRLADEAYGLGGTTSAESYLRGDLIVDVARRAGADAVHPGYGFLAENPEFAQACAEAGLKFVGPTPDAMRALGSKTVARKTLQAAGVPVVPGTVDPIPTAEEAAAVAREIGFPIALKAVSGGGGKGMRVVERLEELEASFRQASSEALASFGDASMYLERLVVRPRHVEVQSLADEHGNAVHLGERECSIQRRHQKLVEESPSPALTPELRARMGEVAVRACREIGYESAGTDRKSTRLNSSHANISYAVFCLKKKKKTSLVTNELMVEARRRQCETERNAGLCMGEGNDDWKDNNRTQTRRKYRHATIMPAAFV